MKALLKNYLFSNYEKSANRCVVLLVASNCASRIAVFVLFFILLHNADAQVNLVINPSFENITTCTIDVGEIYKAVSWDTLIAGGGGTPDLYNACSTYPDYGVPVNSVNGYSYQEAKTGKGYCDIIVVDSQAGFYYTGREYIQTKLKSRLIANKSYCARMYINRSNNGIGGGIDELGMYFDNGSVHSVQGLYGYANVQPQVQSLTGLFFLDTLNWVLIEGTFIATGSEEYLSIGNFKDNSHTHFYPPYPNAFVLYNIDDVSVIESDLPVFAGNDTVLQSVGDSVYLGREREIGLECVWYDMQGNQIETGAGFWAYPQQTTSYIVEQNLCGNMKRDTVTVYMGVGIEEELLGSLSIYPNPSTGDIHINLLQNSTDSYEIKVVDLQGKVITDNLQTLQNPQFQFHLNAGIYFLHIFNTATYQSHIEKLIVR